MDVIFFSFGSNGKGFDSLIVKNGGFRNFQNKNMFLEMNGNKVMLFSITEEPKDIDNILKFSKINKESVDFVVLHQANTYILKNIAQRINFPLDKIPHSSFGVYGNTSSASIPLAISHELNSKIVNRKKRFIFSGFGVGLCWSTIINDSTLTFCPQPTIY